MIRRILLPAALILAVAWRDAPQGPDPGVVVLDVSVSGPGGAPARGLTVADFEVLSDRRPQPIAFVNGEPQPLSVVYLVDLTASARRAWRSSVPQVASALVAALRPGDRVCFGGIAGGVRLGTWSADPKAAAAEALNTVLDAAEDYRYSSSPIWDATDQAVASVAGEPGRRAVVLLTDGRATGNARGLDEVRRRAAALGVSVNVIASLAGGVPGPNNASHMLRLLATTSGGLSIAFIEDGARGAVPYPAIVSHVLSDLRAGYRVGFVPDRADGATHAVLVRVTVPGFTVRTREQYVATPAAGGEKIR